MTASALPICLRRYAMKPRPQKPSIIMAHVEGSGTAATFLEPAEVLTPWKKSSVERQALSRGRYLGAVTKHTQITCDPLA